MKQSKKNIWIHFGISCSDGFLPVLFSRQMHGRHASESGLYMCDVSGGGARCTGFSFVRPCSRGGISAPFSASAVDVVSCSRISDAGWPLLERLFCTDELRVASFTLPDQAYDTASCEACSASGPGTGQGVVPLVCSLLYERYRHTGGRPVALLDMSGWNVHAGRLQKAVYAVVSGWVKHGLVEDGFWLYVISPNRVSYPLCVMDEPTVFPASREPCLAFRRSFIIIEDSFPNGRPLLEKTGIAFEEHEQASRALYMRKYLCMYPLYGAAAVLGHTLGYGTIADVMADKKVFRLLKRFARRELLPAACAEQTVFDSDRYLRELVCVRMPCRYMSDDVERLFSDTLLHGADYFGEVVREYSILPVQKRRKLVLLPLVLALWQAGRPDNPEGVLDGCADIADAAGIWTRSCTDASGGLRSVLAAYLK